MKPAEKKLLELFRKLPEAQRQSLLDFAEFLAGRTVPEEAAPVPTDPCPFRARNRKASSPPSSACGPPTR